VGGVNHYHSHFRLAKFCGLMYGVKHSPVIGRKTRDSVCAHQESLGYGFFSQSQRCIFPRTSNHGMSLTDGANDSG
jgi:hypothetical protein